MCAICSANLISLDLITLIIFIFILSIMLYYRLMVYSDRLHNNYFKM
jgi:hypothetical protein